MGLVAAEDTRNAAALYRSLGLEAPKLVSCHDHNERARADEVVAALADGRDVALVSDAGTPLVSDPGFHVVRAAIAAGARVVPLPGPCAAITALSAAGLPTDRFLFLGFLPRQGGPRREALAAVAAEPGSLVCYEAPHRIVETLADARAVLGDREACLAASVTKVYERFHRGPISAVEAALVAEEAREGRILGEMTLVLAGAPEAPRDAALPAPVAALVAKLVAAGVETAVVRDAVSSAFDLPRRAVYQAALAARDAG